MLVFLFTDIEGSSRLWEVYTEQMGEVIARHDAILQEQVVGCGGRITKHTGDGITAVFYASGQPLACALQAQLRFAAEPWGQIGTLSIRVGLHAGEAQFYPSAGTPAGDYFGPPVNATARVMSAAWGGQILLTPEVIQISAMPEQAALLDLGQHLLKNVSAPQQLYQLLHPQLARHEFPPPRTISGQSIRQAVDERGGQMTGLEPQAMGAALVAVTLLPILQGELDPNTGAFEGNLGVLEDLGATSLRGFVAGFAEQLCADEPLPAGEMQALLQRDLQTRWQAGGENALALRTDASRLLQAVHGVEAAMTAGAEDVKEALAQGLAELGNQFGEFHWMLAGVQDTLAEVRARQELQITLEQEQIQLLQEQAAVQLEQLDLQREQLGKTDEILQLQRDQARLPLPEVGEPPAFLKSDEEPYEPSVFVARRRELARLDGFLTEALLGDGKAVFVIGGPGRGKTALLTEFARHAMDAHPDLLVAWGNCNAYSGVGDAYLPFREVMEMLGGDVEARWAAGTVTSAHAQRLWHAVPQTIQALVDKGPHVIGTLVRGRPLLSRGVLWCATALPDHQTTPWLQGLRHRVEQQREGSDRLDQSDLFQQVTHVLRTLAEQHPLLLVLDDLQWADTASIGLLFHLGRRLAHAGSRILIGGAYRPEEVALGRQGERHPLEKMLPEFKRTFGDAWVDLTAVQEPEGRHFVDALLESEPSRLGEDFRRALYEHTSGHPLFTVELLRSMQERGDLVQDDTGRWIPGPALDWQTLPARVEGVIEARIGRLDEELREFLSVASVEGEEFTAQVVARVQEISERQALRLLSRELEKRHRLVRERSATRLGRQQLSRYRFAHALFQHYLYHDLSDGERALLHWQIAEAIEQCYGADLAPFYSSLANHWSQLVKDGHADSALITKAVDYSYKAGQQAKARFADEEAIEFFSQAITLLNTLPDSPERAQQELDVQTSLGSILLATKGYGAPEVRQTYDRARMLCQQVGETPRLFQVLWGLGRFYLVRTPLQTCRELGEQLLNLGQKQQDPGLLLEARNSLGAALSHLGELSQAQAHLEKGFALYDPQQHHSHALIYGQDPGIVCLSRMTWTLWCLGYPEQALERKRQALALASELDHPFSMAFALNFVAQLHQLRREAQATQEQAEAAVSLCAEHGFDFYQAMGVCLRGGALFAQGQVTEGIAQLRQGMAAWKATGAVVLMPYYLAMLAGMFGKTGQTEAGLTTLAEALATVDKSGEHLWEAEIYRLKGELLLRDDGKRPDLSAVEGRNAESEWSSEECFHRAIDIARYQRGKSLELRATVSLCRLWHAQGKQEQARQMLAEIYHWFTEGFDTADLKEAKALLEELS